MPRLKPTLAIGILLLAASPQNRAAIVYKDLPDQTANNSVFYFSFDTISSTNFTFSFSKGLDPVTYLQFGEDTSSDSPASYQNTYIGATFNSALLSSDTFSVNFEGTPIILHGLERLTAGEPVGSTASFQADYSYLRYSYPGIADGSYADWQTPLPKTGYFGYRITSGGQFYYGWGELTYGTTGLTLSRIALQTTPNTTILAGAVPEPSALTASLLALGIGMAGIRRRR